MSNHIETLRRLGACDAAIAFAAQYPDAQAAWDACHRGDWLAWYLGAVARGTADGSPERRRATLIACLCARTAPRLPKESERAISIIEEWAWGGPDRRWEARRIAYAANAAAAYAAAAYATDAVANAAVANAAANAAAANAATNAAHAVAWHAARDRHLADLADLIRSAIPSPPEAP